MTYMIRELDASTWGAFADLVERNNGIFGGCWCIGYHPECGQKGISHRAVKEYRVRTGRAHAALVIDENGAAQGWCQYGSPEELPNIKHKRKYDQDWPGKARDRGRHQHTAGSQQSQRLCQGCLPVGGVNQVGWGDRQLSADRLDPKGAPVLVDELHKRLCGRSSSAAKKAEADRRIAFDRSNSRTLASSSPMRR